MFSLQCFSYDINDTYAYASAVEASCKACILSSSISLLFKNSSKLIYICIELLFNSCILFTSPLSVVLYILYCILSLYILSSFGVLT